MAKNDEKIKENTNKKVPEYLSQVMHRIGKGDIDDFIFKNEDIKHCSER